jgi:hypothetical protein
MSTPMTDRTATQDSEPAGWVKLDEKRGGVYVLRVGKRDRTPRKVEVARMRRFIQQFSADDSLKQELLALYQED